MKCESTRKKLLAKKNLTLALVQEIAIADELASENALDMNMLSNKIQYIGKHDRNKSHKQKFEVKNKPSSNVKKCYRCGYDHVNKKCKYINATCHRCSKIGHLANVCKSSDINNKKKSLKAIKMYDYSSSEDSEEVANLYSVGSCVKTKPDFIVPVSIEGKKINFILDSAADVTTINEQWYNEHLSEQYMLYKPRIKLEDYNNRKVEILGHAKIPIMYEKQIAEIEVSIVKNLKPCLFGKDCINAFKLDWDKIFYKQNKTLKINHVKQNDSLEKVLGKYADIFKANNNPIKHFKAEIVVENSKPVFCKARPVPYALKNEVENQINSFQKQGTWIHTKHSNWATPIVIVPKKNGKLRICGDFKVTVNPHLKQEQYPLPTQQDLFASLNGGKFFSKIDLQQAYQQIELEDQTQQCLTINTHLGLFKPTRMPYGITTAPAVFQNIMDKMLSGLSHIICYQDDILVTSTTKEEHLKILEQLFERLSEYNVKLNKEKCKFMETETEYLGHKISGEGIHPTEEKISAIKNMEPPKNVSELRTFLGLLNYYVKFIQNASTLLTPLYNLLHVDNPWDWNNECIETFEKCKNILTSKNVLTHYDPNKEIKLSCDASPYGLGAIISHNIKGEEQPIAYASRTLSKAEKNYSHLEKEALAIIFGLKKFQQYLVGRTFTIITDHKPLISIFNPTKATPTLAAARIQRWSLLLSSHNYKIEYKKGRDHTNVDTLSRFPENSEFEIEGKIFKLSFLEEMPVTSNIIRKYTRTDKILGKVINYVKYGWPSEVEEDLKPYCNRKEQLSIDQENVLWGMRVIIPGVLQQQMLELLHDTHPGITKMKSIARSHIWWPKLDQQIEEISKKCEACRQVQKLPPQTPLQSWTWPKNAWDRIHIDYAQKDNNFYLVIVDAYSKWIEVCKMKNITTLNTVKKLRHIFARYGIPREIVSDNGPQLTSEEFKIFTKRNGIKHTLVPIYHPSSNGLAERNVQSFKTALNKMRLDQQDISTLTHKIDRYLMAQHSTPHTTTNLTPAKLFMGREIRTAMSLVHEDVRADVEEKQNKQKLTFDKSHTTRRSIHHGQSVLIRNYNGNQKWIPATVEKQESTKTWIVDTPKGRRNVHIDQVRPLNNGIASSNDVIGKIQEDNANKSEERKPESSVSDILIGKENQEINSTMEKSHESTQNNQERRYPTRIRTLPKKLDSYVTS